MPRLLRENVEDGIYHVFARGNDRQDIYLDDADRHAYLRLLGSSVDVMNWRCLSYCLMSNHVHLLQRLHGRYAQRFNGRHGRTGHLFGGRYGAKRIRSDAQLQVTAAYIARNPVEAGLCSHAEEWPWGSYRACAGEPVPRWVDLAGLLGRFDLRHAGPAERFRAMVDFDGEPAEPKRGLTPQVG
jgi:REP-associated tyrosine transposase